MSSPAARSLSTSTCSAAERRLSQAPVELVARPPSPYLLPRHGGEDGVMRVRAGVASRLLLVEESPVLVRAWEAGRGRIALRAEAVDPSAVAVPQPAIERLSTAGAAQLAL